MHVVLLLQLIALIATANTAPLVAKKLLGGRLSQPLDAGFVLPDGQPLFGRSKTIRGVVIGMSAAAIVAPLVGLPVSIGVLVGITAMLGDLTASFLKRRLRLASSSKSTGLDQIPESLLPLVACRLAFPLTIADIVLGTSAFLLGEIVLARLFFRLGWRDRPY